LAPRLADQQRGPWGAKSKI